MVRARWHGSGEGRRGAAVGAPGAPSEWGERAPGAPL